MIIDAMEIPHDSKIEANICIIGGGAAGIFLALTLAEENLDTLVLEAGSLKNDRSSQALYKGEVSGLPYELDGARTRRLGGSTNCWGGFCSPLDRTMFCKRSWLTDGHWPFDANEMTRHYYKAANFLGLDAKLFSNKESITPEQYLLPMRTHHLTTSVSLMVCARRRFGKYFRAELKGSSRIRVLTHATATRLDTDEAGRKIIGVEALSESGRRLTVDSAIVVLAAGAIENARLMLLSNEQFPNGIGNGYDLVGRYFMDHPHVDIAKIWMQDRPARAKLYDSAYAFYHQQFHRPLGKLPAFSKCLAFHVSSETQAREQIASASCFLQAAVNGTNSNTIDSLRALSSHIIQGKRVPNFMHHVLSIAVGLPTVGRLLAWYALGIEALVDFRKLKAVIEPRPNRESRVTLSTEKDGLGMYKVRLDWRLCEADRCTVRRTTEIICSALGEQSSLTVNPLPAALDGSCLDNPEGTWHQMGTTRIGSDPKRSVVDADCRVHGIDNLYVAGSSIFPIAGNHSPTFTIVAMTSRLAEHLVGELSRRRIEISSAARLG